MSPDTSPSAVRLRSFAVADWLIDPKACQASRKGVVVKLRPQLVDVLLCLARRPGAIVLKDEILAEVWPGQYIAESGLSRCIAELRQLLQDDVQRPRVIETIPKRGYRLVAPVVWLRPEAAIEAPPGQAETAMAAGAAAAAAVPPESTTVEAGTKRAGARRARTRAVVATAVVAVVLVAAVVMLTRSRTKVLTEQDTVLLAFENKTGDAVFDETIPLAMAIQMEQSPYLGLLSPGRIQETLRMMQRPADTQVTRSVGLEICERVGGHALIVTSIASLGRQYAIGLEAVACGTGEVLARRQVTTDRKEQVLAALERAANEIRAAVGEPAASLGQYNVPIVEATTSSLEALRALRRGDQARDRGEGNLAVELYREAASLDPDFALAQARLGTATATGMLSEADSRQALERAFALRERVTLPERLEIEAMYHRLVTLEKARVVQAFEELEQTYPRRATYRRALATEHTQAGRYDAALRESLEAQRLEPNSVMNLAAVARAYLYLNRIAEAREAAERAIALADVSPWPRYVLFYCALETGDTGLLAEQRAWAAAHPELAMPDLVLVEAEEAMNDGRLQQALAYLDRFDTWATARGGPVVASMGRLRMARWEVLVGRRAEGLRRLDGELRRGIHPAAKIDAVKVLMSAGEFDSGRAPARRGRERPGPPPPGTRGHLHQGLPRVARCSCREDRPGIWALRRAGAVRTGLRLRVHPALRARACPRARRQLGDGARGLREAPGQSHHLFGQEAPPSRGARRGADAGTRG